jgi:hypothetical protein
VLSNKMSMAPIIGTTGIADLTFTNTDGTAPSIIWYAVGVAAAPVAAAMRLTQLPIVASYPYQAVSPLVTHNGLDWVTPPPQRSRRGR